MGFGNAGDNGGPAISPKQALIVIRVIWAALLVGELAFAGVVAVQIAQGKFRPQATPIMLLVMIQGIMMAVMVPVTFLVRKIIFSKGRNEQGAVKPQAYNSGNIIFWAGCEGSAFFGLIIALMYGTFWPSGVLVGIAMGLQALSFPTGKPMQAKSETFQIG